MRRTYAILAAALLAACAARAEPEQELLVVTVTNATETFTATKEIVGWIESITIDVVTAGTTGDLTVAASPWPSTIADVTLVDQAEHSSDTPYRPRLDGTDTAGSALTGDPPGRYLSMGDVILTVTNSSAASAVYQALITFEK